MTIPLSAQKFSIKTLLRFAPTSALLLILAATPAQAHWPSTNLTKWLQGPDPTNGIDVLVGQVATSCQPIILADDFQCRQSGYVSDIHIWTSWTNNYPSWNLPITLCFWSDVKAVTNAVGTRIPSHPGTILWCQTFVPGQYAVEPWRTAFTISSSFPRNRERSFGVMGAGPPDTSPVFRSCSMISRVVLGGFANAPAYASCLPPAFSRAAVKSSPKR